MKVLPILVLSALVLGLSTAEAKDKKTDEFYWDTTGLSTQLMVNNFKIFHQGLCFRSEPSFRGCVAALNTVGSYAVPAIRAVPTNLVKDQDLGVEEVISSSFGLSLVRLKQEAPEKMAKLTMAQSWQKQTDLRKRTEAEISKLFRFSSFTKVDFLALYNETAKVALSDRTKDSMIAGEAVSAFLREEGNDAHARLTPKAKLNEELDDSEQNFFGIGATLQKLEKEIIVMEPIKGGPADLGGIKSNDVLLGIKLFSLEEIEKKISKDVQVQADGFYSFQEMGLEKAVELIKGPENSRLDIKVRRQGKEVVLNLRRGKVTVRNVESKIVNEFGHKYGHVSIRTFMDKNLCSTLEQQILDFERAGAEGIILDLRRNGGGLLDQAICMGGLFLGQEVIVQVKDLKSEKMEPMKARSIKITNLPVVTLIDHGSASASEVLSGALRDHKRSTLVGVRSFGKGSVQAASLFFNDKTYLFQTIQRFYQPGGTTNQMVGINPDIEVPVKPDITAEEAFALREGDIFPTALDAVGPQFVQQRPSFVQKISNCMAQGSLAKTEYSKAKKEGRAVDYQLLAAQEVLNCQAQ